jgi:hypothetical protein
MKIYDNEEVLRAVFMLLKRNWTLTSTKQPKEEWEAHFGPIVLNVDVFRDADQTLYDLRSAGWLVKFYVYRWFFRRPCLPARRRPRTVRT